MRNRKQTLYNILQIARKQKHGSHAHDLNFKFTVPLKHTILSAYTSSKHVFQLITHPLIVILHSISGTKIQLQNLNPKTLELVINLNNNRTLLPKNKKKTFAPNTDTTSH